MQYISIKQIGELFLQLEKFDKMSAEELHAKPCPHCGGKLDWANYKRKVRGFDHDSLSVRYSLCCREDGCRRRLLPESVRFMGCFIYGSGFILLISYLLNGQMKRFTNISRKFKMSLRTLKRWEHFWLKIFPQTSFWKENKGRFSHFLVLSLVFRIWF